VFTVQRHVGRLIEVHIDAFAAPHDVEACAGAVRSAIAGVKDKRPVICADYRSVAIFAPGVADIMVRIFTDIDARVERAAMLLPEKNATLTLQIERIVRETHDPNRRAFSAPLPLAHWLGDILVAAEKRRLGVFLNSPLVPPTPPSAAL